MKIDSSAERKHQRNNVRFDSLGSPPSPIRQYVMSEDERAAYAHDHPPQKEEPRRLIPTFSDQYRALHSDVPSFVALCAEMKHHVSKALQADKTQLPKAQVMAELETIIHLAKTASNLIDA